MSWRFPALIFFTRCTRALKGGGNPKGLHGNVGGSFSWVLQAERREMVKFGLMCVEKPLRA
jgi:hypothetical protein